MSDQHDGGKRTVDTRKEPRFKTGDGEKQLHCETTLSVCGLRHGTVIDISRSGIRLLCEGNFEVGQPIFTELTTDRSHGIYQGVIRRVEPWSNGQSILGCSLNDTIPDDVLEELATDGVVNRRAEDRMKIEEKAKMSWQLNNGDEVDVEVKDYSPGGMRITSTVEIPSNVRLRVRFDEHDEDDQVIVEAQAIWLSSAEGDDVEAGVAFTDPKSPTKFADFVRRKAGFETERETEMKSNQPPSEVETTIRPTYLCAAIALVGLIVLWVM